MEVHVINPLLDDRWNDLVSHHSRASAFHQRGWIDALARTYGFEPLVLTSAPDGQSLRNGVVLCRVKSWITGNRLVSLPFSDHCDPLVDGQDEWTIFEDWLQTECGRTRGYAELRPRMDDTRYAVRPSQSYWLHELDLGPELSRLFDNLHKDSIQRKIRRAERERLQCDTGRSARHLDEFYRLMLKTRRRHQLLPPPPSWIRALSECLGDKLEIRLAMKDNRAVAALLTLRHRNTVTYKYGCSDSKHHQLGGMPFLFWRLIEESKAAGAEKIDFGRSEPNQHGLVAFKEKFGMAGRRLHYYCYGRVSGEAWWNPLNMTLMRRILPALPDALLSTSGGWLYRHVG
ncbi:MAG: GNAT family N-acetyltransferase [Acidobacteria bacterium]|nr:GNAT family N-acetyltransferase [Acidobacteriota bacterium]